MNSHSLLLPWLGCRQKQGSSTGPAAAQKGILVPLPEPEKSLLEELKGDRPRVCQGMPHRGGECGGEHWDRLLRLLGPDRQTLGSTCGVLPILTSIPVPQHGC